MAEVWAVIPEGCGKTSFMGGVALYHGDYTPSASVLMAASSRDQCGLLLNAAAGFVHRTPALQSRFRVFEGYRRIGCLRTGGRIQVYAADDRTGDGVIPTLALLDELHRHKNLMLYRTWRGKLEKRGGQLCAISTAGEPDTEFEQIRETFKQEAPDVERNGAHLRAASDQMVLHDWSVPPGGDVEDIDQVKAANPLSTITKKSLRAKRKSPTMSTAHWRRFVCNQPVRATTSAIDEAEWAAAASADYDDIPEGEPIDLGIDLGWKWDTTAMVPLWTPEPTLRLLGIPTIVTPPRDGTSTDPEDLKAAFRRIAERNPIGVVVIDPEAGGEQFAAWIEQELGLQVEGQSQKTTPKCIAYERWMEALREGWLKHCRDPELTRHVLNATARLLPDGRTHFERPSSSRDAAKQDRRVIDGLTAGSMVNAVVGLANDVSVYQERDLLVLS